MLTLERRCAFRSKEGGRFRRKRTCRRECKKKRCGREPDETVEDDDARPQRLPFICGSAIHGRYGCEPAHAS